MCIEYSATIVKNVNLFQESFVRGPELPENQRPPSPATRSKGEGEASAPTTPSHHHYQPQSLTRIKSAVSMVPGSSPEVSPSPQSRVSTITHETRLSFPNFVSLFQAFRLVAHSRKFVGIHNAAI